MTSVRDAREAPAAGLRRVELRLLGSLDAAVDGSAVPLGAPKQRALLALLALRANEATPVELLIDALWPDDPPASARHAVQVYVSRLRGALGDAERIEARSRAYLLRVDADEIDLLVFRQRVADARQALADGDPTRAAEGLRGALALWRGRALADLGAEPSVRDVVLELEEERLEAVELRIDAELEAGHAAELVPELEELVAGYPAREHLHAQLMLALHRTGRPEDAATAYDRARRALQEELGLEPSARLVGLDAAIARRDPTLLLEPAEIRERRHLPAHPTELVGRQREISEVVDLLAGGRRLVTLTGAGGIGKTRLALAAAERLAAQFDDGVWFVDLSVVSDPMLVSAALAQALGVAEPPDQEVATAVGNHLADKRLLLVVDNFEQVGEAAPVLSGLLRRAPRLAVAVTSRVPLRLFEEVEYAVPPLDETAAVQLFVERARAVSRGFELDEGNARDVAEVCTALGGLPLAIELAGATVKELSPAELRERIESSLDFLVGGSIDSPARQQTMRATIEWSCGLLGTEEQRRFAPLAVFSGGWSAEAAREVCGATAETLRTLCETGMIFSIGERFGMLTPIREFAQETLAPAEVDALALGHATYFAAYAEEVGGRIRQHGMDAEYLERFGRESENIWAALRWAHGAGEKQVFARLAAVLGPYCYVRGPLREARHWLELAFADPPDDAMLHGLIARGLGMITSQQGDYGRGLVVNERAYEQFRRAGDPSREATALINWASDAIRLGEYEQGYGLLMQCRERTGDIDDERSRNRLEQFVVNALGVVDFMNGRLVEAERWFVECVEMCERLHEQEGAATALMNVGMVALQLDRLDDAAARFREGLRLAAELQKLLTILNCVVGLAAVALRAGDTSRAARLLGFMQARIEETGAKLEPFHAELYDDTTASVRSALGEEAAEEAFALGRRSERDAAVAYALEA